MKNKKRKTKNLLQRINWPKEKKKLLEELQRTKEDLEDLEIYIEEFSTFLPIAVCTVNLVGIIININKAFEDLTGYKSIEIVGKPLITVFLEKKEVEKMADEILKKEFIRGRELTLILKGGKEIPVSVSSSIRKDKEGNFIGYFVGITDISELKKFQKGLEEKIKERTKELQKRINELERFHRLTVGRELKMVGLKEEIKKLKEELEKYKGK